jgi:hypothetical protein
MRKTQVVHCREPHDVYIGRPSEWGNPFRPGRDGTRAEVLVLYRSWFLRQRHLVARLRELKGKRLGCWCKSEEAPTLECHGDILSELADNLPDLDFSDILEGLEGL